MAEKVTSKATAEKLQQEYLTNLSQKLREHKTLTKREFEHLHLLSPAPDVSHKNTSSHVEDSDASDEIGIPERLRFKRSYTLTESALEARRKNSKKSTGPKTEKGKAASSKNSWKHGLFAQGYIQNKVKPCKSTCPQYPCELVKDNTIPSLILFFLSAYDKISQLKAMPKIIVKFQDGKEETGEVLFFNINQPTFQMQADRGDETKETLTIRMVNVKSVLFLKKDEGGGTRLRTETIEQSTYAGTMAFRLVVEFQDGEVISGSTLKYTPNDKGFFLIPINPAERSERIYVNAQAAKNVDCKRLLGKILVDQKKITHDQLAESLKYQQEHREKKIGVILREKAIINEQQLHESLQQQKEKNKMLGEILLEAGYITSDQLEYALHIQQENREKRLGQVLVELKYITPSDICIALATQFHKSWIDLSQVKILPEIATSLPEDLIRKFEVIPVEKKGRDTIVVATSQPQDSETQGVLSKLTSLHIELVVAYEGYITSAINAYFPPKE